MSCFAIHDHRRYSSYTIFIRKMCFILRTQQYEHDGCFCYRQRSTLYPLGPRSLPPDPRSRLGLRSIRLPLSLEASDPFDPLQ